MRRMLQIVAVLAGIAIMLMGTGASARADQLSTLPDRSYFKSELNAQLAATKAMGGTIINDTQISYGGGKVVFTAAQPPQTTPQNNAMVAPAASRYACPLGWLCLWSGANFAGSRWQFRDEGYFQYLASYNATPFNSFYNNRYNRYFLHLNNTGSPERCYEAQTAVSQMDSTYKYAQVIYLATSNNPC